MDNQRIENIEAELRLIRERNSTVEKDKAWEGSFTRRILIAIFTYISIGVYMWAININMPWLNAIIPTVGFMISTLTLPFFKKIWINKKSKEIYGKK